MPTDGQFAWRGHRVSYYRASALQDIRGAPGREFTRAKTGWSDPVRDSEPGESSGQQPLVLPRSHSPQPDAGRDDGDDRGDARLCAGAYSRVASDDGALSRPRRGVGGPARPDVLWPP